MARILDGLPRMTCPSCNCTFEYDASDVETVIEQYWSGFWSAWQYRNVRRVKCPGCAKMIRL